MFISQQISCLSWANQGQTMTKLFLTLLGRDVGDSLMFLLESIGNQTITFFDKKNNYQIQKKKHYRHNKFGL